MSPPHFYQAGKDTEIEANRLPHWSQKGACYFVTFRLADAIPMAKLRDIKERRERWTADQGPKPWPPEVELEYYRRFMGKVETWLDMGSGDCVLRDPANARIVAESLGFFEGQRSVMHAWVVMPNHVHTLFDTLGDFKPGELVGSWKGYSARQINARLGRSGSLWQKSYFDRMIRDWKHFGRCVRYIYGNPEKAKLKEAEFLAGVSDLGRRFLK